MPQEEDSFDEMVRLKHERASAIDLHFHAEVGRLIRTFAYVEDAMASLAARLLRCDHVRTQVLWSSIPTFRAKLQLTERLAETFLDQSKLPEFRALIGEAQRLSVKRNLLAHGTGRVSMDAAPHLVNRRTFKADIGLGYSWQEITDEDLVACTAAMTTLQEELFSFSHAMGPHVHEAPRVNRA